MTDAPNSVLQDETSHGGPESVVDKGAAVSAQAAPDTEKIHAYTKAKLAIAAQLRILREVLKKRGGGSRFKQCEELLAKLAEDRFTLAVLGQFKRGKSSLMNAIIGRELLPVGVLPLTSAVTVLKFGAKEQLFIQPKHMDFLFPEAVSRLADYVTEKGNPGNRRQLRKAFLELPVPFLRRGLEFVDTPGVGSAIQANTATTYSFLPECDAVVFVTSVETPFTRVELEFLKDIRQHVRKIFFIVNKTDLLADRERAEVLDFIRETIRGQMSANEVRMFPVSSRLGLAGKLAGDAAAYAASGLKGLEEALAEFLTSEKAAVFLNAVLDRSIRLSEQESVEVELRQRAQQIPQSVLLKRLDTLTERFRQHAAEREQVLERLRQHIQREATSLVTSEVQEFLASQHAILQSNLNRWLAHCRWQPTRGAARRAANHLLRLLRRSTLKWLASQNGRLSFAADPAALEASRSLQANIGGIPCLAGEVFGMEVGEHSGADLMPPFRLQFEFDAPFLPDFRWQPRVPGLLVWLPAGSTRRWLSRCLAREWHGWSEAYRHRVVAFVCNAVSDAYNRWSSEVTGCATEAGVRVLAAITREQPSSRKLEHDGGPDQRDAKWSEAALETVRNRLATVRGDIVRLQPEQASDQHEDHPVPPIEMVEPVPTPLPVDLPNPHVVKTELAADLRTSGCAVCEHLTRFAFQFLSSWQYALYTDEKAQRDFAAELGFCPLHTWGLETVSSPVGVSVGHAKLVERISQLLALAAQDAQSGRSVSNLVRNSRNCRVCEFLREAEETYIERLVAFLDETTGRDTYARSQGVCLRHLGMLVSSLADDQVARFVLTSASKRFEEMAEDMQSYGMKTEALRRHLRHGEENDAYLRAMLHLVGSKANCYPWQKDAEF